MDYEGPAGMRGASEPVEELRKGGGHDTRRRDHVANKGDRRRSHTTRRRGHARTRYEVTSRKGGQRQQPYGRPCATAPGSTRCLSHGKGPARSARPSPAEKNSPRVRQRSKATANLMVAQQLSWILSSKKTRPGSTAPPARLSPTTRHNILRDAYYWPC